MSKKAYIAHSELVQCGRCEWFMPDTIGDGRGIGQCRQEVEFNKPRTDYFYPPRYPRARRLCDYYKEKGPK